MSPTIYLSIIGAIVLMLVFNIVINSFSSRRMDINLDDIGEIGATSAFVGFCIGFVIWLIIGLVNWPESVEYTSPKRNLSALKDGQSMNGNFFLGSGSFDGDMKYYGYESLGQNKYKLVEFPSSSIIVEDIKEGEKPYFVEIRKHSNPNSEAFKNDKWMMGPFELDDFVQWEIHIPKGSVLKNSYELDLN